ncbi:MAG TPA: ATP-dependent DNA helicase RecG [Candidatus Binataceae bacterium]
MSLASSSDSVSQLDPASPIETLSGIGPKRAAVLAQRGIFTVLDAVLLLPVRYQDWRCIQKAATVCPGMDAVVEGTLGRVFVHPMAGSPRRKLGRAALVDSSGASLRLVWFNIPARMAAAIPVNRRVLAAGRVSVDRDGAKQIVHPRLLLCSEDRALPAISPVYRLPKQIGQKAWFAVINRALSRMTATLCGAIPDQIRPPAIPPLVQSLRAIHRPAPDCDVDELRNGRSDSHRALAVNELFTFQLAISLECARAKRRAGIAANATPSLTTRLKASLPFALTAAQQTAIDEITRDMASPRQMNRILIGDVGSGKTLVAFFAALRAIESGYQAVVMAPTSLLAEQHLRTFNSFCAALTVRTAILTAHVPASARREIQAGLAAGTIQLVFGTHALIRGGVRVPRLALALIDEQHRFGVFDRALLKNLAPAADMLLMTATPIPRSLALSLFAHLGVSRLDQGPPGRTPVETIVRPAGELGGAAAAIRDEVAQGNRAFVIAPRISEEDDNEMAPDSIEGLMLKLPGLLGGLRVGSLHGRVESSERDAILRRFRDGLLDVLVATTLVEVGIDVPDATVIAVFGADRFGLAQLHQLRGRVGRGSKPSRCFLVPSVGADPKALERLGILAHTADGNEVAAADLALRGPGDLFGTRQSGALPLRFSSLMRDVKLIEESRSLADRWLAYDPKLVSAQSRPIRSAIDAMLQLGFSMADVG